MNLSVGIVGLPNVGKSTLFNALLKKQQAFVANYPFATIEPNVGVVPVPDERLEKLADIVGEIFTSEESDVSLRSTLSPPEVSRKRPPIVPTTVKFVDIAGLVKGANEGAGLGNKFLSHIREVSVIAHVVRDFEDENIVREGSVDPNSDYQTIQTELMLADIQTIHNSKLKSQKSKPNLKSQNFLDKILAELNRGIAVRDIVLTDDEKEYLKNFQLLTAKPEIAVLNVSEDNYNAASIESISQRYKEMLKQSVKQVQDIVRDDSSDNIVVICAKIESELAELSKIDQKQYLKDLGLEQSGLERLIKNAYDTLGLISFLTAGEKEVRAWTIEKGTNAIDAAGEIHTDFIKKFIKAEVVSFDDFVQYRGWKKAREEGKTRLEGKDYVVRDGDVIEFKIGS